MPLSFPPNCDTPTKRTAYCYRAMELLRLLYNVMGKWHREGITEAKWNKLPARVRTKYPYTPLLADGQWKDFIWLFDRVEHNVIQLLLANRQFLQDSTEWTIDIDNIVEE